MQMVATGSETIFNKHLYKELILNIERAIQKHYQLTKSDNYIHQKKKNSKRALELFMDRFNPNYKADPIHVLKSEDFDSQVESFFSETIVHLNIETRYQYRGALRFIGDEVIVLHGTKHWITNDFDFDQNADLLTRFKICIDSIYNLYETSYKQFGNHRKFEVVTQIVNNYCKDQYLDASTLRKHYTGYRSLPLYIEKEESADYFKKKKHQPYLIIRAIEKLSMAPTSYLTSVLEPVEFINRPEQTKSKFPRKPNLDFNLITKQLKSEIHLYAKYKTDLFVDKARQERWIVRKSKTESKATILNATCVTHLNYLYADKMIPSLGMFNGNILRVIRYVVEANALKKEDFNLFNLTQPNLLRDYFNSLIVQGQPLLLTHSRMISSFSCMWNPTSCFFHEYRGELCPDMSNEEIIEMAEKNTQLFDALREGLEDKVTLSENSTKIKNKGITDLEDPSRYVRDAVAKAKKVLKAQYDYRGDTADSTRAVLSRGICIISCLLELPLRARNWSDMKIGYRSDGECIYKNKKGLYEISIPKSCFKNFDQKIIPDHFVHIFSKNTSLLIGDYLEKNRSAFLMSTKRAPLRGQEEDLDYFLVSRREPFMTVRSLSRSIEDFFKTYGDQTIKVGGIRIHFFRDIVATSFLKQFPGAYAHAGMLLLDSEQTMKENYGHLQPKDALSLWQAHNENRMMEGA